MRYLLVSLIGGAFLYAQGQCEPCTPDADRSPRPFGFSPPALQLHPNKDTTLVIYFTFPDTSRVEIAGSSQLVYPNYAIWVDELRLDVGVIKAQNGDPFAYNIQNPSAGSIHFDQPHRYKQWGSNPNESANFVVYQNPGNPQGQPAGSSPPFGCARVCIKTSSQEGSDTLRVKVRAFISAIGDGINKDTANLRPSLLGRNAWLDTVFRYAIVISTQQPGSLPRGMAAAYSFRPLANPAYGEAGVTYTLPRPMVVRLRAYSLDGREVFGRDLGLKSPGTHEERFQLPAGQYFIRLETPEGIASTRLTVIE